MGEQMSQAKKTAEKMLRLLGEAWQQGHDEAITANRDAKERLREELAEVKRESLKLSALVVERDYQITLANKGYDYEGAVEDARHYKALAEKYKAELAAYRLWAEVEITDLRHDVKLGELAAKLEELK